MSNKLKAITTKAKALYKSGKYAKWTDAIKEASKSLAKTTVKKTKSGLKSLAKKVYESKHLSGVKKKTAKKKIAKKKVAKKSPVRNYGSHKDTASHNVKISVMSGTNKGTNAMQKSWEIIYGNLAQEYISSNTLKEKQRIKKEMSKVKLIIDDIKKLKF
jgi:hypothetical protein